MSSEKGENTDQNNSSVETLSLSLSLSRRPKLLIEEWLPIEAIGVECRRENSTGQHPPPNRLHVWWARRPLIASRAAVLGSLLPAWSSDWPQDLKEQFPTKGAYKKWFTELLGIVGDPVAAWHRIQEAKKTGEKLKQAYEGPRAFTVSPTEEQISTLRSLFDMTWGEQPQILDPTGGGGSIPLESLRFGINTRVNELNPVATIILKATLEYPIRFGKDFAYTIEEHGHKWSEQVKDKLEGLYSKSKDELVWAYIFVRVIKCPYTGKPVPLSPNWWLKRGKDKWWVELNLNYETEDLEFRLHNDSKSVPENGTVKRGNAISPWNDKFIDGDYIKKEAQEGRMSSRLYAIAYKRNRRMNFRSPNQSDYSNLVLSESLLSKELSEHDCLLPLTSVPSGSKTAELLRYGIFRWIDRFTPRQQLVMLYGLESLLSIRDSLPQSESFLDAIATYICFAMTKIANYNSMGSRWEPNRGGIASSFERHDFAFKWTFAEMPMNHGSKGFDWGVSQISDAYRGIAELLEFPNRLHEQSGEMIIDISQGDATNLPDDDESLTSIIIDPPYYDNVQYAELADAFYIWIRAALREIYPDWLAGELPEKDIEAVMNPARFERIDKKRAKQMAKDDYERKMTKIFAEAHRVLKSEGIMTVMFNHKDVDAWDTLSHSLIEAGFVITASWPIHTESAHSMHQANKAASASTILLTCRKRDKHLPTEVGPTFRDGVLWEDIQEELKETVRRSIRRFRFGDTEEGEEENCGCEEGRHDKIERKDKTGEENKNGKENGNGNGSITAIDGVDLFIAVFGPALSVISEKWPVYMSTLDEETHKAKLLSPEMALDLAREVIVDTRLEELFGKEKVKADEYSEWYIIGWSIFKAREFPFDEANKLARTLKVEVKDLTKEDLVEKKGSRVILLPPTQRLKEKKKTPYDLPLEHLIDLVQALMAAALVDQTTGLVKLMAQVEKQQQEDEDVRFSEANLKRYLQALIYSIPRLRNQDGTFELEEAEALDLLAVHFQLDLPEDPPPREEMNQKELDLDEEKETSEGNDSDQEDTKTEDD